MLHLFKRLLRVPSLNNVTILFLILWWTHLLEKLCITAKQISLKRKKIFKNGKSHTSWFWNVLRILFFIYFIDTLTEGVTFSDCYFWTYAKGWNQQRDFVALSYRELYINDFSSVLSNAYKPSRRLALLHSWIGKVDSLRSWELCL